jgi:FixJ family two-component response regulator
LPPMIDIIDDDEAVRDSTHALLELHGYDVRKHPSAEAFLSHPGEKAACLLVDHYMPGMTGLDLLEHLHAKGDRTPALVMTARSNPVMVPRAARVGARLLEKPLEEGELVRCIERLLSARHECPRLATGDELPLETRMHNHKAE